MDSFLQGAVSLKSQLNGFHFISPMRLSLCACTDTLVLSLSLSLSYTHTYTETHTHARWREWMAVCALHRKDSEVLRSSSLSLPWSKGWAILREAELMVHLAQRTSSSPESLGFSTSFRKVWMKTPSLAVDPETEIVLSRAFWHSTEKGKGGREKERERETVALRRVGLVVADTLCRFSTQISILMHVFPKESSAG